MTSSYLLRPIRTEAKAKADLDAECFKRATRHLQVNGQPIEQMPPA